MDSVLGYVTVRLEILLGGLFGAAADRMIGGPILPRVRRRGERRRQLRRQAPLAVGSRLGRDGNLAPSRAHGHPQTCSHSDMDLWRLFRGHARASETTARTRAAGDSRGTELFIRLGSVLRL